MPVRSFLRFSGVLLFLNLLFTTLAAHAINTRLAFEAAEEEQVDAPQVQADVRIVLNQVGYLPDAEKFALLLGAEESGRMQVMTADDDPVQELEPVREDRLANGLTVRRVDFSQLTTKGDYYLQYDGIRSPSFRIGEGLFDEVSLQLQRSYYLQRCGVALRDAVTGLEHEACHTHDGELAHGDDINRAGERLQATGGWHDAGDFGKYMAPATVSVSRLLGLYMMAPGRYPDNVLQIPESGNGKSDLLDEVAYELEWMLKMQRMDGAVYRKLSGKAWVSARLPEEDKATRYVYGISSPETAKFAASMAMAARAYAQVQPVDAERYLTAASHAWHWLEEHPGMFIDEHPGDNSGSGGYMSSDTDPETTLEFDEDDRLAAAIELYLATGEKNYRDYVLLNGMDVPYNLYEWKDPSALSLWNLMEQDSSEELAPLRAFIRLRLMKRADRLLEQVDDCPFALANQRYVWGSNKMTAEEGITLLHAWKYSGERRYLQAALAQVDYLLGRNPFGMSFVTGVGAKSVQSPVHLFGSAIRRTLPGLLVGGPNGLAQDKIAPFDQAMFSYVDNERAYSVNEYAIDYYAPLIGLLEILAIYRAVGNNNAAR